MTRLLFPLILGLGGTAVLVALGLWQLDRLAWKEALLAEIEVRITEAPVALPPAPTESEDAYRAVRLEGQVAGPAIPVFGTWRSAGAGYRTIVPFVTDDRRVLVDMGVSASEGLNLPEGPLTIEGNLNWPNERETTPDADVWTKVDVAALSARLDTEPVLVVARNIAGADLATRLVPTGTDGIPNNHLGYAIQWFGLAIVWAGMTAFLLWRMHSRTGKDEA